MADASVSEGGSSRSSRSSSRSSSSSSSSSSGGGSSDEDNSLRSLEELVTCPIHLGRLQRPKQLACSHVFCLSCLQRWARGQRRATCPVCRTTWPLPPQGAAALPSASAHECVLSYISSRRCRRLLPASAEESAKEATEVQRRRRRRRRRSSLRLKQQTLSMLAAELARRSEPEAGHCGHCGQLDRRQLLQARNSLCHTIARLDERAASASRRCRRRRRRRQQRPRPQSPVAHDSCDDAFEASDTGADSQLQPSGMKRHRLYKLKDVDCLDMPQVSVGDCGVADDAIVLLNLRSRSLLLHTSCGTKDLLVRIGQRTLSCLRLQVSGGLAYVTGHLEATPECPAAAAIACVQLDGRVLHHSLRPCAEAAEAPVGSFCVGPGGRVVLALPRDRTLEFLCQRLRPTGHWFAFQTFRPTRVAWTPERRLLWVSCPADGLILIVNDTTGVYRKLTTTQIFDSVPEHIVTTSDGRVLFTDNRCQRIFWIVRRRDFIFVQRLEFGSQLPAIGGVATLSDGRVLLTAANRICCLRPLRPLRHTTATERRCCIM